MVQFFLPAAQCLPWSDTFWPGLTPFGPLMWQAEVDTELTDTVYFTYRSSVPKGVSPGQKALFHGKDIQIVFI